ncbi:MAG: siroheme decarboxylase subunit beta, partial [Planctomycetota bacterium]
EGVSHNYLRNHHYNLWFTLQAKTQEQIKTTLSNLSARFDIDFYSLPVECIFKLDVRFDAGDNEQTLLKDVKQPPETKTIELKEHEKLLLSKLQNDLPLNSRPFDFLCSEGLEIEKVLETIKLLLAQGVINRIAAVVNHHKLGFVANVLFVCQVPQDRIIEAGENLSRFRMVSHCYQRQTFENWPYNLFAMMHAKTMGEIQQVINKFTKAQKIDSFQLLPTTAELKKRPVTHHFY